MKVHLKKITKRFGDFTALDDFSLEINSGAFHFLLGPSGSGKTTLLRIIAGLEEVTSGHIYFGEEEITHKPAAKRGIGMVFQNYALWPHMKVYDNIAYALKLQGLPEAIIQKRIKEVLDITQMIPFSERYPGELSGGQQQRVALARALVVQPKVLLFDEPLSNLDATLRAEIRDHLVRIQKELSLTSIYVTHDCQEALAMGTDITVMQLGKEIQTGAPRDLYNYPNSQFLAHFIGDTNLISGKIHHIKAEGVVVATDWGLIQASNLARPFAAEEAVVLSIRPEAIKIDLGRHELKEDINVVAAKLIRITYLGEVEKLLLEPPKGALISVSLFNAPEYDVPQDREIKCFFKASKVRVLPLHELPLIPNK